MSDEKLEEKDIGSTISLPEPKIFREVATLASDMGSDKLAKDKPEAILTEMLSNRECLIIAGLEANETIQPSKYRREFIKSLRLNRISLGRQSRKEIIHTLRAIIQQEQQAEQTGILRRIKGFVGGGRGDRF
jgi:hypothetical protein